MKGKQIIFLGLLILAFGCKKDSNLEETPKLYYFNASMNGKESDLDVDLRAQIADSNSPDGLRGVITATQNLTDDTSRLSFSFINYKSYTVTPATYPNNDIDLLAVYQRSSAKDIFYTNDYQNVIKFTLVIEEMTSTYIAGIFNGTVFDRLNLGDSFTVTKGKFKVPIVP